MAELYSDLVGQPAALQALRLAARRPVHAYLIVGPAGTGKRAAATNFAAALLCLAGPLLPALEFRFESLSSAHIHLSPLRCSNNYENARYFLRMI